MYPVNGQGELFVSHKATVTASEGSRVWVDDREFKVSDLRKLNDPHVFAEDILGNLVLEDGLRCDYSCTDAQAKLF